MAAWFADWSILEWAYLGFFASGLLYALFLAVFGLGHGGGLGHGADLGHGVDLGHAPDMGHGFDLGHGVDLGHAPDMGHGFDLGHGADLGHGVDLGHGADVGHGVSLEHGAEAGHAAHLEHDFTAEGEAQQPPLLPWNPVIIATFLGGLGGFGLLGTRLFGLGPFLSLLVALPAGTAMAAGIFFLYRLLLSQAGVSSAPTWQDIRNAPARVLISIPEGGLGEVVYEARGFRYTRPARSIDGRPIPADTPVTVLDIVDGVALVDLRYVD